MTTFNILHSAAGSLLRTGCVLLLITASALGQTGSVQEIMKAKPQWRKLAEEGRKFQFEARFQGRAADSFRVDKVDFDFKLPGSIRLPDRMRDGQRLEITGKFMSNSGKIGFLVSGLVIRDTDLERLEKEVAAVPRDQPDKLLEIASRFVTIAEFYEDQDLAGEISAVRLAAIRQKRALAAGKPDELKSLIATAESLQVDPRMVDAIRYEILLTQWQTPNSSLEEIADSIQSFTGWDQKELQVPARLQSTFPKDAVENYDSGSDNDRRALHRQFYISVRLQQIEGMLKPDSSNGLSLATLIRTELPDQTAEAQKMEQREVQYRLGRLPELSRLELQQLVELLTSLSRGDSTDKVIDDWVIAQERRFGTTQLEGILRTADENLFVAEQWKRTSNQEKGIELLKLAWNVASQESPADATQIADRLKRLGWEHLNGNWMTLKQMEMLPKDDIQLAIREGRVVRGMTVQQVKSTLGQPARVSRISTSRTMRELWIYDGTGSAGIVVRFKRSLLSKTDENTVEDVSRIAGHSP